MTDHLSDLSKQALKDIRNSSTLEELDSVRVQYLGKKGSVSSQLKKLSKVDPDDRPRVGKEVNKLKKLVENEIANKKNSLNDKKIKSNIEDSTLDVTMPGRTTIIGNPHPVTSTLDEIEKIFLNAGFLVEDGPEIEDEYHNFTALNIP